MIFNINSLVRTKYIYFDEYSQTNNEDKVDFIKYLQMSSEAGDSKEFITTKIDLKKDYKILLSGLSSSTRYDIKRAEKSNLCIEILESAGDEELKAFIRKFGVFAKNKKIKNANYLRLKNLAENNQLVYAEVFTKKDNYKIPLYAHMYISKNGIARLLYSIKLQLENVDNKKNIEALNSNKYLHWNMIKFFKNKGYRYYDFGGITTINYQNMNGIDRFKTSFGGEVYTEYNLLEGKSWLGKLYIALIKLR